MLIMIRYESLFERAMNRLWAIDRATNEIRREVPEGSLRNWLACRAERLDRAWRERYVCRGGLPPGRRRRKMTCYPPLPRAVRLRLRLIRQADSAAYWLSGHGLWRAAKLLYQVTGLWRRKTR